MTFISVSRWHLLLEKISPSLFSLACLGMLRAAWKFSIPGDGTSAWHSSSTEEGVGVFVLRRCLRRWRQEMSLGILRCACRRPHRQRNACSASTLLSAMRFCSAWARGGGRLAHSSTFWLKPAIPLPTTPPLLAHLRPDRGGATRRAASACRACLFYRAALYRRGWRGRCGWRNGNVA